MIRPKSYTCPRCRGPFHRTLSDDLDCAERTLTKKKAKKRKRTRGRGPSHGR